MRIRLFRNILLGGVIAAITPFSIPAHAAQIAARVPFSFMVNETTFPPGTYHISTEGMAQGALLVNGLGKGAFALVSRLESEQRTDPKLVFYKYGDEYVLRQVWMGGGDGDEIPRSRVERELLETARNRHIALTFEQIDIPIL